ncbi:MAG: orotate phosphoribosyltransferase [Chlorobiota bacterium]
MTKQELCKNIYDFAHITGEFKLRSGVTSHEYFDKYQFESRPNLLKNIAKYIIQDIMPGLQFDLLAPLEMGGIPIATAISLQSDLDMVLVRKEAKEYGTCKLAEGPDIKGKRLLIIEDVVTSGGQIVLSANELRERGAIVEEAICVINRESTGEENLQKEGIKLHSLFTMTELKGSQ